MYLFFADDSIQTASRQRMGRLEATGGIAIPADHIASLERTLNFICTQFGFPAGEEFKWSPRRNSWMHTNLVHPRRSEFFEWILRTCADHAARIVVVLVDTDCNVPNNFRTHRDYVTAMLIERIDWFARSQNSDIMVVVDRPGGGRAEEHHFLADVLDVIQQGTRFVRPLHICMNALSADSCFIRILQAADLVTSSVTAYVAGENRYSPSLVRSLLPLVHRDGDRVGGVGIKIEPSFRHVNLYHWLFSDEYFWRGNVGTPLPLRGRPYYNNADEF